jgi:salicylate hydroxylase
MGDAAEIRKPLKIAIIGGGIGGLSLLLGILKHGDPRVIQPHLYEAAHAFAEIGAGVGFLPNAVRAMYAVDPRLHEAYGRIADEAPQADVNGQKKYVFSKVAMGMDGRGGNTSKAFDQISTIYNDNKLRNVHRAVFLDEMVKLLPGGFEGGLVSFKKRCTDIKVQGDGVTVVFADGTTETVDAAIGCDGVKSVVRNILHEGQEKYEPRFTGKYAYRGLVPVEDAIEALGEATTLDHVLTLGYGGHLVTFLINQGKTLNVVAFQGRSDWDHGSNWVVPATVGDALEDFKDWSEPIKKLLSLLQKPDKWGLFDLPPLKTYTKDGRICLLGDCAHASTPHQGAGAGMAIEDAAVLSRLLGEIKTPDPAQLTRAFVAYDTVRRERTQKVVSTSRSRGLLYDFELPGVGDDLEKLRDTLSTQWDWIWDLDIDAHCQEAIRIMHQPDIAVGGFP